MIKHVLEVRDAIILKFNTLSINFTIAIVTKASCLCGRLNTF